MIEGMVPNPMNMPRGCAFNERCTKCMAVCKEVEPEEIVMGERRVRCHLYGEKKSHKPSVEHKQTSKKVAKKDNNKKEATR